MNVPCRRLNAWRHYECSKIRNRKIYVSFDLGLLNQYNYYTGVIFKGYTYGVGDAIVTGGRYDKLLPILGKKMHLRSDLSSLWMMFWKPFRDKIRSRIPVWMAVFCFIRRTAMMQH